MWEGLDQRKFPRLKLQCDIDLRDERGAFRISAITDNIGAGGVCVILPRALERSARVALELHLADGLRPVGCAGKICWVVMRRVLFQHNASYDTGIEFLDILEEDRSRIRKLVLQHSDQD